MILTSDPDPSASANPGCQPGSPLRPIIQIGLSLTALAFALILVEAVIRFATYVRGAQVVERRNQERPLQYYSPCE